MKNQFTKKFMVVLALLTFTFTMASCTREDDKIVIGEGNWQSVKFHDEIAKFIIENGYGEEVDIVPANTSVLVQSLRSDSVDVTLELWAQNIPTYEEDIKNGEYKKLSTNFDDNRQGIFVPTYLVEGPGALAPNLETVQDLKDYADLFPNPDGGDKAIIYGGPDGWSATEFLENKMEAYGLDEYFTFKKINSSASLAASLAGAYEKKQPWVGYNWEPTWVMGLYDMTLLEDTTYNSDDFEQGIGAFPTVDVNVVASSSFIEQFPEVSEFLSHYQTSSNLTNEGLAYMQEHDVDADDAAKWFLKEHQDIWSTWVPEEVKEKVLAALE